MVEDCVSVGNLVGVNGVVDLSLIGLSASHQLMLGEWGNIKRTDGHKNIETRGDAGLDSFLKVDSLLQGKGSVLVKGAVSGVAAKGTGIILACETVNRRVDGSSNCSSH